jgi:hypothetical protein
MGAMIEIGCASAKAVLCSRTEIDIRASQQLAVSGRRGPICTETPGYAASLAPGRNASGGNRPRGFYCRFDGHWNGSYAKTQRFRFDPSAYQAADFGLEFGATCQPRRVQSFTS